LTHSSDRSSSGSASRRRQQDAPTTAQLKDAIDRGRTGDKVDWREPGAAPLGTDDEAAGTPPSPDRIRMALAQEVNGRRAAHLPSTARGERSSPRRALGGDPRIYYWAVALLAIAIFVIGVGFFGDLRQGQ
jgi:hypothetical protein